MRQILLGARIFDGTRFHDDHALVLEEGHIAALVPAAAAPEGPRRHLPAGSILAPGFVDLQINGGGGLMVDGQTDLAALRHICATHRALGSAGVLPTLITDTPAATAQVIAAGIAAAQAQVPGFLGLHLEGPHLDPRRHGATESPMRSGQRPAIGSFAACAVAAATLSTGVIRSAMSAKSRPRPVPRWRVTAARSMST